MDFSHQFVVLGYLILFKIFDLVPLAGCLVLQHLLLFLLVGNVIDLLGLLHHLLFLELTQELFVTHKDAVGVACGREHIG